VFETIGMPELLIIGLVVLLLFGVGKVGRLGKDLGEGVKEFRRAMKEEEPAPEATVMTEPPGAYITGTATPLPPQAAAYPQPVHASSPVYAAQPQQPPSAAPAAQPGLIF
jgi:sec-independent protein translocase protein TatA